MANESQRKYFCPRLLDYVCIVGSRHPSRNNSVAQKPELLRRYPLEDHTDFPLAPDVVFFCQPEGCISTGPKRLSLRESTSFVFTLTEKDTGRCRYGICLNFYRPFEKPRGSSQKHVNKSERHTSCASTSSGEQSLGIPGIAGADSSSDNPQKPPKSPRTKRKQKTAARVRNHTLTSLCFISHHPFFSTFRECLFVLRQLIESCNDRSCARRVGGSTRGNRDSVWGVITGQGNEATPSLIMHEVREIETWILRMLSAPVPVPGKTRVEITVLPPELHTPLIFALPDHTRFSLVDFPLHLPLELLGVDTCLKVLTMIILEHKILLQSRDYNALTMSVMAFVAMLYPLEYMFPVIPLLPTCMSSAEQLLLAPTPYIIGVPATFLMYKRGFGLPDDVWLVDLDSNKITQPTNAEDLSVFPEPEGSVLKNHLKQCLDVGALWYQMDQSSNPDSALASMSMSPQPIKDLEVLAQQNPDLWKQRRESLHAEQGFNPLIYGNDVDSVDVATRVAMVRFFNSTNILANFEEHTRTLRLYPRPVVAFQLNSFLKSRPIKTAFTARLAKTQAVEYFAEWALSPFNVVFQRVQTGVFDPLQIGDKHKWFRNGLQKIDFPVYDVTSSTLGAAVQAHMEQKDAGTAEDPTDESGSDSDGAESTSSSYSSLSDFVIDIQNSDINGETPMEICEEQRHLTVDEAGVYMPPDKLQVPDNSGQFASSDSALSAPESEDDREEDESSDSSVPEYSTNDDTGRERVPPHPEEALPKTKQRPSPIRTQGEGFISEVGTVAHTTQVNPSPTNRTPPRPPPPNVRSPSYRGPVTPPIKGNGVVPAGGGGPDGFFRYDNVSPGKKEDGTFRYDSGRVTPTRPLTPSGKPSAEFNHREPPPRPPLSPGMKSVDSAYDTLERQKSGGHAGGFQRAQSTRSSLRGPPRPPPPSQGSLQRAESVRTYSAGSTPPQLLSGPPSPKPLTPTAQLAYSPSSNAPQFQQQQQQMSQQQMSQQLQHSGSVTQPPATTYPNQHPPPLHQTSTPSMTSNLEGDTGSLLSTLSSELNDVAETASNTFSEIFGTAKVQSQVPNVKAPKPFAPLGTRQSLVQMSPLVKHDKNPKKGRVTRQQSISDKANTHSDNQQFLKDIVTSVLEGQGVGWLKITRVKKLMEDENYRNFVVSRLNTALDKKLTDEDVHLEDVPVSRPVFKGMLSMVKAIISGLENTYQNQGVGGMASAVMVMEIIHTHYWEKDTGSSAKSDTSNPSLTSSPFGSRESLSSMAAESSKGDTRSLHEDHMVAALDHGNNNNGSVVPGPGSLYVSRDVDNNINYGQGGVVRGVLSPTSGGPGGSVTTPTAGGIAGEPKRDSSSGYGSESNDMLHQLVKNKEQLIRGNNTSARGSGSAANQRHVLSKYNSVESDDVVSESGTSTLMSGRKKRSASILSTKSHFSTGFRFHEGRLISLPIQSPDVNRTYLFESLFGKDRSWLWDQMQFWEDAFLDAVAQERDIIGMDQGPTEMMERYNSLGDSDKKRLEYDEDRLLACMLYNMVAFMIMTNVSKNEIRRKVRRLLGKCHIGLICSKDINNLLDQINNLHGNDIDLKPVNSRLMQKQSFTVHWGPDNTGDMLFMEVCDDCIILRSVTGAICDRWWYEKLVNMTYCPKTKVLCLWRKHNGKTQLNKFYTKKCKELYFCVKDAMEKAAARNNGKIPGADLGGEFPVQDLKTGQGGLLQVCMEGIGLLFHNSKLFIELKHIKKCYTMSGSLFVLEEFDPKTRKVIQRKYKSNMADQICYAVLCVFSYVAAGMEQKQQILDNAKYRTL